jgi:predicted CXXCH cytochrome family protein
MCAVAIPHCHCEATIGRGNPTIRLLRRPQDSNDKAVISFSPQIIVFALLPQTIPAPYVGTVFAHSYIVTKISIWENMRLKIGMLSFIAGVIIISAFSARGASVVNSKHDLSTYGSASNQPCAYCHTPHFSNPSAQVPLWNRAIDPTKSYTRYDSPTMDSKTSKPNGVSLACLGCHDGVSGSQALYGNNVYDKHDLINAPGPGGMPDRSTWPNCDRCHSGGGSAGIYRGLGTDLSNDHPISMPYPTVAQDSAFQPSTGIGLPLYKGNVECASCHNVHDPSKTPFLRISNVGSALCYKCHNK